MYSVLAGVTEWSIPYNLYYLFQDLLVEHARHCSVESVVYVFTGYYECKLFCPKNVFNEHVF